MRDLGQVGHGPALGVPGGVGIERTSQCVPGVGQRDLALGVRRLLDAGLDQHQQVASALSVRAVVVYVDALTVRIQGTAGDLYGVLQRVPLAGVLVRSGVRGGVLRVGGEVLLA